MNARLNLKSMTIVEYEKRVKRYAHPNNKGKISVEQLKESFKDTKIFTNLKNPRSTVNKMITSPFFCNLVLSHNQLSEEEMKEEAILRVKYNSESRNKNPGTSGGTGLSQRSGERPSIEVRQAPHFVGDTFENNTDRKADDQKEPPTFGTDGAADSYQASAGMISVDALMLAGLLQCKGSNKEKAKCFYVIVQP